MDFLLLSAKPLSNCSTAKGRWNTPVLQADDSSLWSSFLASIGTEPLLDSGQRLLKLQHSCLTNQGLPPCYEWGMGGREPSTSSSALLGISPLQHKAGGDKKCLSFPLRCHIPWLGLRGEGVLSSQPCTPRVESVMRDRED